MSKWTIYSVTVSGEDDCQGLYVAQSEADAIKQFRVEANEDDSTEWEAHVAFEPDALDGIDTEDDLVMWLRGYCYACERFGG